MTIDIILLFWWNGKSVFHLQISQIMMLIKNVSTSVNMAFNFVWIMGEVFITFNRKFMWMSWFIWIGDANLLCFIPWWTLRARLTSQIISIPNRFIFLTDTKVSWSWIFFAISYNVVVNGSLRAWLALVSSRVPIRSCLITVYFNAFVHIKVESLFGWACLICFDASLVLLIPLFIRRAIWYTLFIFDRPAMIWWALFAFQCFLVIGWFIWWTLETFKVYRVPIWGRRWAHWCCSSFLTLLGLWIKVFIWGALGNDWFWDTLLRKLIERFFFITNTTSLLNLIIERFVIIALITTVSLIIPKRSLRRTKWMSIVFLYHTFFGWWIKVVSLVTFLLSLFALPLLLVPCFIFIALTAFFYCRVKIRCRRWTWLTWIT